MNTEEIQQLKLRLLELEKQEKDEIHKVNYNSFKVINNLLTEKKNAIQRNRYSKSNPFAKYHDQETLTYLESFYNILQNMDERLKKLESK
jgi:hypothetical protein